MDIKNLFDPAVKQEIIDRINKLQPDSVPQWGKMNVSQMLAHCRLPIETAYGRHRPKGNAVLRIIGPLFKSKLWDSKPYSKGLPTDASFVMTGTDKEFEPEKNKLTALIMQFTPGNLSGEKHPVFGKMTKENWSMATWKHLDHHLRQFAV